MKDTAITLVLATRLSALEVLHNICNIGTHDLPDTYARSPRALSIHIRQISRAHVTNIKCMYTLMYACMHTHKHTVQI